MEDEKLEYVGFWPRVGASLIDTILLGIIIWPLLTAFYGDNYWTDDAFIKGPMDFLLSYILPAVAVIIFWIARQATPGKMAIGAKVVDAKTGNSPSVGQLIGRYFSYYISIIIVFLGFLWVVFDARKQGWHDKLAGTVVIRKKDRKAEPVSFDN